VRIFINYRKSDEAYVPVLLEQALSDQFGAENVFRDSTGIPLGEDFRDVLWSKLAGADVVLAVIGPQWLDGLTGRSDDYVLAELDFALSHDKLVVPILVGGVAMPAPEHLPAKLVNLPMRQYARIGPRTTRDDIDNIVRRLVAGEPPHGERPSAGDAPTSAPQRPTGGAGIVINVEKGVVAGHDITLGNVEFN
jgi:hypothetical protein